MTTPKKRICAECGQNPTPNERRMYCEKCLDDLKAGCRRAMASIRAKSKLKGTGSA